MKRKLAAAVIIAMTSLMLLLTVSELPTYGETGMPAMNEVTDRYLNHGVEDGGATNIVSDIIVDYRAYDTLMETTVLFTAIMAVTITLKQR